ncbi:MAG TPA: ATP-binding protein [Bacilli bacterium]|nr:ATP-binding protein [Bacilli bacterium]
MSGIEKIKKELFTSKEIADFCEQHSLTDAQILSGFAELFLHKDNTKICAKCLGKIPCQSTADKMITTLKYENGQVRVAYKDCPYIEKTHIYPIKFLHCNYDKNEEMFLTKERIHILKAVDKFCEGYQKGKKIKGIYLHGGFGVGKTFILAILAKRLEEKGIRIIFACYPDLMRQIKSAIGDNIEEIIAEVKMVDVLVLDDIGSENNTPFVRDDILSPILQYRMDNDLPVFMSSNLSIEKLGDHFSETNNESDKVKGQRIIQRIRYLMNPFELDDKNYRNN